MTYNILEIANTHGGDISYVYSLLKEFEKFDTNFGIKFQPFKFDRIATKDFSWYPVYEKLFFTKEEWKNIIAEAKKTKEIWIDVFDTYSAEITADNFESIVGLKMQASVLYNFNLLGELEKLDFSEKKLILNISAYPIDEIRTIMERINQQLKPQQLILQIGFQAYPTKLEDSSISKIAILQKEFPNHEISYTEHIDGTHEESTEVPALAVMLGANYIEKHIMHSTLHTEYDFYSSVKIDKYQQYIDRLSMYESLKRQPFINKAEEEYLRKSVQIPILKINKKAGQCVSIAEDLEFKRTDLAGLNVLEVQELLNSFHILRSDKKAGETLQAKDFRKANIAVVIACRMKSSRLPKKAILPIGKLSSIELCVKNVMGFKNVNNVVLATSTEEEDAGLKDYTYSDDVIFHRGDPEDVIQRYLDIADKMKIDIILRVTGDCPFLSNEIAQINLKSHFEKGADYSTAPVVSVGTNSEIINTSALREIKKYFPDAKYSEYMTFYFTNNPKYFRLNTIELPSDLVRDYRLTLDYQDDLDMFNKIEAHFEKTGGMYTTRDIFKYLDENPEIPAMNQSIGLVYKTDQKLIDTLNKHTTILESN
jgi:N,N'-diacetyllegionaminate synthase